MNTSSKTQNSATAKTASAHKTLLIGAGLVLAAVVATVAIALICIASRNHERATLHAGTKKYALKLAVTSKNRTKGLGGIKSLPASEGMLFVFAGQRTRCFWMKDMNFPLDIIWLNQSKRVVHIEQNVSPNTYPHQFCPSEPAGYVLELNAGQAQSAGILKGQTLTF